MNKQIGKYGLLLVATMMLLIALPAVAAVDVSWIDNPTVGEVPNQEQQLRSPNATYAGTIKIYITEVVSRWKNSWNDPYHYSLLEFAIDSGLTLTDGQVIEIDKTIDISSWAVAEDNLAIVTSVFDSVQTLAFADPPSGAFFMANYTDAAALAYPGGYGLDTAIGANTHTVFMEEGTATW